MCGIAGILGPRQIDLTPIFSMTRVQTHRGPDDAGHVLFGDAELPRSAQEPMPRGEVGYLALGHRRLSIIDRSAGAHQPMSYSNGRYWIVYNGEVYNYRELREELIEHGFPVRSASDTEVILAAFAAWGNAAFPKLNGMWALAIWDRERRELTLSRDRFGVKPLHILRHHDALFFASEIKALLAGAGLRPRASAKAVHGFLVHGAVNTDEETFFADVWSFPPGHTATVALGAPAVVQSTPFWSLDVQRERNISFQDACDEFRDLLTSSVSLRMRSDVPVGACLSGGLDSSSIVCLMKRDSRESSIHTFTARFPEPEFDESEWARTVIDATAVSGHFSTASEGELIADLDRLIWHQEEPFSSASLYAQWRVMKQAREHEIPVLLDGQGADEILGGYRKFYAFHILSLLRRKRVFAALSEAMMLARFGDRGYLRWREGARYLPASFRRHIPSGRDFVTPELERMIVDDPIFLGSAKDLRVRQALDITRFSLPSLLRYEDRNSMAWSVESRVPFLDYRLVEFALALPAEHKLRGGMTKAVLRSGLRGIVPDRVLDRRDKMGFVTPQANWMEGALGTHFAGLLEDAGSAMGEWFDFRSLLDTWRNSSASGRRSLQSVVFRAGVLAQWFRRFDVAKA